MIWFLTQQFIVILVTAALFAWFGWWLRAKFSKIGATRSEVDSERSKNQAFEDRARRAEAETKVVAAELAALKNSSVARGELEAAKKATADEQARAESFQVQLKKARELQTAAEARINEAGKALQTKVFQLENELAGLREQAARDRQAAQDALAHAEKAKAAVPSKPEDVKALETELLQARRSYSTLESAAAEARTGRDKAESEAAKLRDKMKILESELAVARGSIKPGSAAAAPDASTLAKALAESEARANEAMRSVNKAREEVDALRARVAALETELGEVRDTTPPPTEADIDLIRHALHAAQAEADEAKKAHNLAASQAVVLRTQVGSLQAEVEKLKTAAAAVPMEAVIPPATPAAPVTVVEPAPAPAVEPAAEHPQAEAAGAASTVA